MEVYGGRWLGHQETAGTLGVRAEGLGGGRRSHRVLHLSAADSEEIAPRARSNRPLREDGQVSHAVERQAREACRAPAPGGIEEGFRGPAGAHVSGSSRVGSAQVRTGKTAGDTGDFREAAFR